jgi:hypothetical protein
MSILKRALASARSKSAPTGDSSTETETLRRQLAESEAKTARAKAEAQQAGQKAEQARVAAERELIRSRLTTSAARLGAVKSEELADLLASRCRIEGDRVVSLDDPAVDHEAVVKTYLEANPHHQRATVAQGSGASPYPGTAPSPPPKKQYDLRTSEGANAALHDHFAQLAQTK